MKFYSTLGVIACFLMVFFTSKCNSTNYPKSTQMDQKVENVKTTLDDAQKKNSILSDRDALDLVKKYIDKGDTTIFEALTVENGFLCYYFKNTSSKIQYQELDEENGKKYHLIQQYESVIDNEDTQEGHTVTSNWYKVDDQTGQVIPEFDENGNLVEDY